jgi:hypothetical protein
MILTGTCNKIKWRLLRAREGQKVMPLMMGVGFCVEGALEILPGHLFLLCTFLHLNVPNIPPILLVQWLQFSPNVIFLEFSLGFSLIFFSLSFVIYCSLQLYNVFLIRYLGFFPSPSCYAGACLVLFLAKCTIYCEF